MQQSLGRVNDHSVYRDLIAAQKPAHILRLSAASEQPGVNIFTPWNSAFLFPSSLLILLPAPLPLSLTNLFICTPLCTPSPPASVHAVISLGTRQQQQRRTYAFTSPQTNTAVTRRTGARTQRYTHRQEYTHDYSRRITWEWQRQDVIISIFVYSEPPVAPVCGNRSLWNQINYVCQFPQETQNTLLIRKSVREIGAFVPSDLERCFSVCLQLAVCPRSVPMCAALSHLSPSVCIFSHTAAKRILQYLPSKLCCWVTLVWKHPLIVKNVKIEQMHSTRPDQRLHPLSQIELFWISSE